MDSRYGTKHPSSRMELQAKLATEVATVIASSFNCNPHRGLSALLPGTCQLHAPRRRFVLWRQNSRTACFQPARPRRLFSLLAPHLSQLSPLPHLWLARGFRSWRSRMRSKATSLPGSFCSRVSSSSLATRRARSSCLYMYIYIYIVVTDDIVVQQSGPLSERICQPTSAVIMKTSGPEYRKSRQLLFRARNQLLPTRQRIHSYYSRSARTLPLPTYGE
jgi:hypothetical protein